MHCSIFDCFPLILKTIRFCLSILKLQYLNKLFFSNSDFLEQLYRTAEIILTNSGYRCFSYDRNVGGLGAGQHANGCADNIVCYDQKGNRISSKKVCCATQGIGFDGIANIDFTYTAIHVDTRTANFWKGDEVKTTAYSVTDDFYKYYGLSKSDVYPASAKKSKAFTITVDGMK